MDIRASYSTACESELLAKVVPLYLIARPDSCLFWQRGINDTYQVHSAEAIYSLRVYRHNLRTRSAIEFEIAALNYLADNGINVAHPIAKRHGGYITEIQSPEGLRYVIATTHAKGAEPDYDDADNGRLVSVEISYLLSG